MNRRISNEEKSSYILGKYSIKGVIITSIFTLFTSIFVLYLQNNFNKNQEVSKRTSEKSELDSSNLEKPKSVIISNNKIEQKKSSNANIQIGNDNSNK